jgi:hypothetical protein
MQTRVKPLRGFLSAPAGTDLSPLIDALEANNIHLIDPANFAPGAVNITDKLIDGINHADLFVGVLGNGNSSANVLFELGCASALGKQILVIVPEGYDIPSDIKDLLYIRTSLENREAIDFVLEQLLNAPKRENQNGQVESSSTKIRPLGDLVDSLLEELNNTHNNLRELALEKIVLKILENSGSLVYARPILKINNERTIRPNFAVWIDDLTPYFDNPTLIEIKNKIDTVEQAKLIISEVSPYLAISNLTAIIILGLHVSPQAIKESEQYSNIYCFALPDFLKRLRKQNIGQIIINERNLRLHGIEQ